jgi:hypothetical protein
MQVIFRTAQILHFYRNIEAHVPNNIEYSDWVCIIALVADRQTTFFLGRIVFSNVTT